MIERDFKAEVEELHDRVISDSPTDDHKTNLDSGESFMLLALERERLRHGITEPGPERDEVDAQTISLLKNSDKLGPEHSVAEAAFRRLARNPESAADYVDAMVEARRLKQSLAAKKPRKGAQDPITRRIDKILEGETRRLSAKEVGRLLTLSIDGEGQGSIVFDGDEYKHVYGSTLKAGNLASRVSDARGRKIKRDLG
jgi:hypothetical protein